MDLDAVGEYLLTINDGGTHRHAVATSLRAALTYAVGQSEGHGARVTIHDPQGREFDDLQLWAEFVKKYRHEHNITEPVHFVRQPHPAWFDTSDMFNERVANHITNW